MCAALRGPGGATIVDPSALHLPAWMLFAPDRAREIVSDVLCRGAPRTGRIGHRCPISRSPRFVPPRSASFALSSKSARSSDQDAFHRPSAPSPCRAGHFRACTWDHEEPATGVVARVLVALATTTRLPTLVHWVCARASRHVRRSARPVVSRPGPRAARRLLQSNQSASTTAWIARLPPLRSTEPALLALARVAGLALPCRVRAAPPGFCVEPKPDVSSPQTADRGSPARGPSTLVDRHCA